MLPVLISIGSFPITAFGLFLTLAFLLSLYFIWRAAQVYEIDSEKLLDIFFLSTFAAFITARVYFLLFHLEILSDPIRILLFNRYPGFSFWGGLLGGSLALYFFARRFKLSFWQVFDFALVGLFIGLSVASFGCLLGSCQVGIPTNSFIAVNQVGVIGQRFPIQGVEAIAFFLAFLYLWKKLLRFHFAGSITALGLILLGIVKLGAEFLRANLEPLPFLGFSLAFFWSLFCIVLGFKLYYRQSRRSLQADLRFWMRLITSRSHRSLVISSLKKSWYNLVVNSKFALSRRRKELFKGLNVKSNPTKF